MKDIQPQNLQSSISYGCGWFDVENERYTTAEPSIIHQLWLWFDVENERYTTCMIDEAFDGELWFDVENERNTTKICRTNINCFVA